MKKLFLVPLMLFAMLASCNNGGDPIEGLDNNLIERKDIVLTKSGEKITNATNNFAIELFKALNARNEDENVVVSPLSATEVLAMICNGAVDETYDEIVTAMGLDGFDVDEMNEYFKTLHTGLLSVDPSCKLALSNSLWLNTSPYLNTHELKYKQDFVDVNKKYFGAELREENFQDDAIYAKINDWCSKATDGIISNYVDKATHNMSDVRAAQINATLFKGGWSVALNPNLTVNNTFTNYKGEEETTKMMECKGANSPVIGRYCSVVEDLKETIAFEMPFGNKAFSMLFVMPPAEDNINAFVATLSTEAIEKFMPKSVKYEEVLGSVTIPKFKASTKGSILECLKDMGIGRLFTPAAAQLDKMVNKATEFHVARFDQETAFEISEEGAKAASVSSSEEMISGTPKRFNRPFVYLIRECSTGAILFMGKYEKVK